MATTIKFKRILAGLISICIFFIAMPIQAKAVNEEPEQVVITDYQPTIIESIDSNGFTHPGVGLTKDMLENLRQQIIEQKEPWYSYYKAMLVSDAASITKAAKSSNQSSTDPTKAKTTAFNSQNVESYFSADSLKAYTQAILYYITGNEDYRANAMHIIRIWSQMDPDQYGWYTDPNIHTGIPMNRMVAAAEILRYTSCKTEELKWTEKDTNDFSTNLINGVIDNFQHVNHKFMNQHLYPLIGSISGYIFTGNKERYDEAVEWFTVNKTATDQGQNGSIKQLFRLVDTDILTGEKVETPIVEHAEMGRDGAHGCGDLTNSAIIGRLLHAQGTKVDPIDGTVSTKSNAVDTFEFLDYRLLKAAEYFWNYMLGYDTPWIPLASHTDAQGNPTDTYKELSTAFRGRMNTANFWDMYYYYKYTLGIDMKKEAPRFEEAFSKRLPSNYYYGGSYKINWDNGDGGGDFWLYIPKEVETEGGKYLPKEQENKSLVELEDRYTKFDKNSITKQEGDTSFIEVTATEQGSKIAPLSVNYPDRTKPCVVGLKFRTNGTAKLEMSKEIDSTPYQTLTLPDTNGQWKYITYDMGIDNVSFGQLEKNYSIFYFNIIGDGTKVDIDCLNFDSSKLTVPVFNDGNSDLKLFAYSGASSPITYDFSAKDANKSDVITYKIYNNLEEASINPETGMFSMSTKDEGTYSIIVSASDGTSVSTKNVEVKVVKDRQSAVSAAIEPYNENIEYESSSLDSYKEAYDDIMNVIDSATDDIFYKKLAVLRNTVENLKELTPLLKDGSINYLGIVTASTDNYTSTLVDDDSYTTPSVSFAPELYLIFDFGSNFRVSANTIDIYPRQGYAERIWGAVVFGSNDGENWTQLTEEAKYTEEPQRFNVKDEYKNNQYRFFKVQIVDPKKSPDPNITEYFLEMSEFRIFGKRYEISSLLDSVVMSSDKSVKNRIHRGDTVKLSIKSKKKLDNMKVTIQDQEANLKTTDNINWIAEAVMGEKAELGEVKFCIKSDKGDNTEKTYVTSDNSKLYITNETGVITFTGDKETKTLISSISSEPIKLIDSSLERNEFDTGKTFNLVNNLFDNNINTSSDFFLVTSRIGGYVTFDFNEGNSVSLKRVDVLGKPTVSTRLDGLEIQGSNDNVNWKTISDKQATTSPEWQSLNISDPTLYRYIRVINNKVEWYGNMSELRFYSNVGWIKSNNKWYYLSDNGSKKTGWINYKGKWYYMNPDGSMASDTVVDGYAVDKDGAWIE